MVVFLVGFVGFCLASPAYIAAGKRSERDYVFVVEHKRTKLVCMAASSPPSPPNLDFFDLFQQRYLLDRLPMRLRLFFKILRETWESETYRFLSDYEKKVLKEADSEEAGAYRNLARKFIPADPLIPLTPARYSYALYEWQDNPDIACITLDEHLQFLNSFLYRAARLKIATNWDFINEYLSAVLAMTPDDRLPQVQQGLLKPVLATLQFDSFKLLFESKRGQPIPRLFETVLELAGWLDLKEDWDDQRFWFKIWQLIGPAPIDFDDIHWSVQILFVGKFSEPEMINNAQLCETLASLKPVQITRGVNDWEHFRWLLFDKEYYDLAAAYPYYFSTDQFFRIVAAHMLEDHREWFICWDNFAVLLLHTNLSGIKYTYPKLISRFQSTLKPGQSPFKAQMMAQVYYYWQGHQFRQPNVFVFPHLALDSGSAKLGKSVHEVIGQESLWCVGRALLYKYFGVPLYLSRIKSDWEEVGIEEVGAWMQTILNLHGNDLKLSIILE